MIPAIRPLVFLVSIYIAFFASGASSLFAEVTWNRMLVVVVGNSMSATAIIIVVFMGGLGIGSYAGGEFVRKRRPSLVPYMLLEVAIGAYILVSPILFTLLSDLFSALAESVTHRAGLAFVRILVNLLALFLPAFLMGATFPAMIHGAAPDSDDRRTGRIGFLYSVNTLGAAAGCFTAGYYLLLEFGVQTTLTIAFCLNMVAVICALVAGKARAPVPADAGAPSPPRAGRAAVDPGTRKFLNVAVFFIGFVSLGYEVLLTRLGILFVGNGLSVFPRVLTAFLLGTGISAVLGTWIYGVLHRKTPYSGKLFGWIALGAGALVIGTPYLLITEGGWGYTQYLRGSLGWYYANIGIIVVPTIFLGALLPISIRMMQPEGLGEATREAAGLYALNTAGGVLGAALANHALVPVIGLQGSLVFLTLICVAVAGFNLYAPANTTRRYSVVVAGAALLAVLMRGSLPDLMVLYNHQVAAKTGATSAVVRLAHEGRAANVSVIDLRYYRIAYRDMFLNGVSEASTRYWHTQVFKLLGALPVLLHEEEKPKDALVIAFGAGMTAGSVLVSDQVASLDVVDLNPDVEGINDLFREVNGDVFHQPRFHFHNDDGRNFLVTNARRYDLIISDSTHPHAYDSWVLYTREFYQSVKKRLLPGGIFAQWVPVDPNIMQGELFRIHLNTFRSVFPNTVFWLVAGSDQGFLLATPEPLVIDPSRLQQRLDRLPGWFRAKDYQIDTVPRLAGFFWLDGAAISRVIGNEKRINTDDLHYFDQKDVISRLPPESRLHRYQASLLPHLTRSDDALRAKSVKEQVVAQHLARYFFLSSIDDLISAYCQDPDNGKVRYYMAGEYPKGHPDYATICRGVSR